MHCRLGKSQSDGVDVIHIELSAIADNRTAAAQLPPHQDLLRLVFSITGNISTAGKKYLPHSVEDALKKICLFSEADSAAIWGINRLQKGFDLLYHWRSEEVDEGSNVLFKSMPLSNIKNIVLRLRQERTIIVHQMAELNGPEREELQVWHQGDYQALICHIIYSGRTPVGTIIVARKHGCRPMGREQRRLDSIVRRCCFQPPTVSKTGSSCDRQAVCIFREAREGQIQLAGYG